MLILKDGCYRAGPCGAHSCRGHAWMMVRAWTSPEDAAAHLVQGHGDRRVEGGTEKWMSIPKEEGQKGLQMPWPYACQTIETLYEVWAQLESQER